MLEYCTKAPRGRLTISGRPTGSLGPAEKVTYIVPPGEENCKDRPPGRWWTDDWTERMKRLFIVLALLAVTAGCPVTQSQQTPVPPLRETSKATGTPYWLYVPSNYSADRSWPLVITLHGTYGWDGSQPQISEWKALAEQRGLIVAAPDLRSAQGILPVVRSIWYQDLDTDEKAILALIDELVAKYHVDPDAVLLTGFSAGGYAMYYTGLRNPQRFNMLIARACNSDVPMFEEKIPITDAVRKLPVVIFCGKDDLQQIQTQSWAAFRYLRERGCPKAVHKEIQGGHLRRPELAYRLWLEHLPQKYRSEVEVEPSGARGRHPNRR